ncbi:MAG: hypothetical protein ACJ8AO_05310 [Gemmatimonadaceae bacterium]
MHTPFQLFGSRSRLAAFATASLLVAAAACRTATSVNEGAPIHAVIDEPFQLRVGQRAELATDVAGRPFRVTFIEVTGDSRCPDDVRCVWEGDARVALRLELDSEAADTAAHTSGRFTPPPELAGHRVVVEALDPATHSGRTIPQSDYVATLRITESR